MQVVVYDFIDYHQLPFLMKTKIEETLNSYQKV